MNNFTKRTVYGTLFIATVTGVIISGAYPLMILFLLISTWALWEFYTLFENTSYKPNKAAGIISGISLYLLQAQNLFTNQATSSSYYLLLIPLVTGIFIWELFRNIPNPFLNIGVTLLGILYVSYPFSLLYHISINDLQLYDSTRILGLYFILWANDTGAYLVGSSIGKMKLFSRISPGKTWEGTIGGVIIALAVAYTCSLYFSCYTNTQWIVISIIISTIGTLGDLVESLLKRSIGVKDSGSFMPGHGGILDRFDSLLFSLPVIYFYLSFIG